MNRKSYADIVSERYINANSENSNLVNNKDLENIESHFYDELNDTEVKGFPFGSDFVNGDGKRIDYKTYDSLSNEEKEKYRLKYYYMPFIHELYIGTTGSGKTTTCIEPQLRAISSQKNKPNLFISDPKGEIFLHNVKHLKDNGYNVQVLNFKNPKYSNSWNPLEEIYLKQMEIPHIGENAKVVKGNDVDPSLRKMGTIDSFNEGFHIVYNGVAFPSYELYKEYIESRKYLTHSQVTLLTNQICRQLFPEDTTSNDKSWNNGAREFFNGIMLALLDDAIIPGKQFTKEMFNMSTLNDVYTLVQKYDSEDIFDFEHFSSDDNTAKFKKFKKGKSKEAIDKIELVSEAPPKTKKGYLSTCESLIDRWMNGHIFSLTTETNINLDDSKSPIALFIITRDYDKSDNMVAGLFLNWVYNKFLEKAEKEDRIDGINGGRPIHFMLDEFANIPAIPDFEIKIATSRSRNMWFHIYLQSYEQLESVYGQKVAGIIFDNCNQQSFLGSQSVESKQRFSNECGKKTVTSIKGEINSDPTLIEETQVLSMSLLNNVEEGYMYSKRITKDVIKTYFVRSYECAKAGIFKDFDNKEFEEYLPFNFVNPADEKHKYSAVIPAQYLKKNNRGYFNKN